MKEYIEREATLAALSKSGVTCNMRASKIVARQPAADVAPVRHGRWMDAESDNGCTLWHCSICSYPVKTIGGYPIYKYCPMCGALMDGKEDDHGTN